MTKPMSCEHAPNVWIDVLSGALGNAAGGAVILLLSTAFAIWLAQRTRRADGRHAVRAAVRGGMLQFNRLMNSAPVKDDELGKQYSTALDAYQVHRHHFSPAEREVLDDLDDNVQNSTLQELSSASPNRKKVYQAMYDFLKKGSDMLMKG